MWWTLSPPLAFWQPSSWARRWGHAAELERCWWRSCSAAQLSTWPQMGLARPCAAVGCVPSTPGWAWGTAGARSPLEGISRARCTVKHSRWTQAPELTSRWVSMLPALALCSFAAWADSRRRILIIILILMQHLFLFCSWHSKKWMCNT